MVAVAGGYVVVVVVVVEYFNFLNKNYCWHPPTISGGSRPSPAHFFL